MRTVMQATILPPMTVAGGALHPQALPERGLLAVFGPTAVGKTDVALALADALRAAGRRPVAVSADALQVYAGLEILTGVPSAAQRRGSSTGSCRSFRSTRCSASASTRSSRTPRSTRCWRPATCRSSSAGPGSTCARRSPSSTCARSRPRRSAQRWEAELERVGAPELHARLAHRAPWAAVIDPNDRHRIVRAHALLDLGELEPPEGPSRLWTSDTRHPTRLVGLVREREDLYARIDARAAGMVERGAVEEVRAAHVAGASPTARKALGFDELLAGDLAGDAAAHAQLTPSASSRGCASSRASRCSTSAAATPAQVAAEILSTPWTPPA